MGQMKRSLLFFTLFLIGAVPCEAIPQGCTTSALWCYLPSGFPSFTVNCPRNKNHLPLTYNIDDASGSLKQVGYGYTYSFTLNDSHSTGKVCDHGPSMGATSCISYSLGRGPICIRGIPKYPPQFCTQCVKNGGACSTLPNGYKTCVVK